MTADQKPTTGIFDPMPSRKHITLFFAINLFLCSWHLYDGMNDNIVSRAAMVAAIVEHGTLRIDDYHDLTGDKSLIDGHYYSEKAPLPALIVLPFWWAAFHCGLVSPGESGLLTVGMLRLGGFLCGSVPFALIITLVWMMLRNTTTPQSIAPALLATLPFYGSFLFTFSGSWFGHLTGALLLLLAYRAMERRDFLLCGLLAGAAVLCDYPLAVFPLFWTLLPLLRREWNAARSITLGGLPWLFLLLAYNYTLTGNALSNGYAHQTGFEFMHDSYGLGRPHLRHVWDLTFSDYRGVFFFMPVLLPTVVALLLGAKSALWRDPVIVPAVLSVLIISGFGGWHGGWTYGPRYLTGMAVLLAYRSFAALLAVRWARWIFLPFAGFGLVCALADKSTIWFSCTDAQLHPVTMMVLPTFGHFHTLMQWPFLLGVPADLCTYAFLFLFVIGILALVRMDRAATGSAAGLHSPYA